MIDYIRKKGIVYKNQYHIVFCTKYRRKVLDNDEVVNRLKDLLYNIANEKDVIIHTMEIMPDHVHLFIEVDPRLTVHKVVKDLKGISSRILRSEFPKVKTRIPSLWTRNYFCSTVGRISEDTVMRYIDSQKGK